MVNMKKFALVQLTPKDMRSQDSINMGLEIVAKIIKQQGWQVDIFKFGQQINNLAEYDIVGFSIFYFTQMLNLVPFLRQNGIEPMRNKRNGKPLLLAGGQGIQNPKPITDFIDIFSMGDGEGCLKYILENYTDKEKLAKHKSLLLPEYRNSFIFNVANEIDSDPVLFGKNAMIELTRGCKYRCKFCQYGWTNGKYREKPFDLVLEQIAGVKFLGIKNINLLSCNLGGYSKIVELLDYCVVENIRLMNTDMRIDEYSEDIAIRLDKLKVRTLKVGVESFDLATRKLIGKDFSDEKLEIFIGRALKYNISNLHFYLIYGLPNDNYDKWFEYMGYIKNLIKNVERNMRIEFSITNFEPAPYTPLQKISFISFLGKHDFMRKYLMMQEKLGYIKQDAKSKDYKNTHGRLGRKQRSYNVGMWLLHGDETIGKILYELNIKGVGRSLNDKIYDQIRKLCEENSECYQIAELEGTENIWK